MTEAEANEAILEAWEDGWESRHPDDPDDPDFVPWTPDNEAFEAVKAFARITIVPTVRLQTTSGPVGTRRYQQRGIIAVQLFCDASPSVDQDGGFTCAELADDVRRVFEGGAIAVAGQQIALFEGESTGVTTDGRWAMKVVRTGFLYEAIG